MPASPVPAHAERLDLFDHIEKRREVSKYAPPAMALKLFQLCPGCKENLGHIPYFETRECECGLKLHVDGSLFVWRDAAVAAE